MPVGDTVSVGETLQSDPVVIDCTTCVLRDIGCSDCVVTVVLGAPSEFDDEERRALAVLADSGLVPPLRLVSSRPPHRAAATDMPGVACG